MDYIIASTVVTDEIRFADKKTVERRRAEQGSMRCAESGSGATALCL